jgi:hypothetical protein
VETFKDETAAADGESPNPVDAFRVAVADRSAVTASGSTLHLDSLVNKVAVQFLKETDDTRALSILALMTVAKKRGSKAARDVRLNLSRWSITAPPPVHVLPSDDERKAAIKALGHLRKDWVPDYALRIAADKQSSRSIGADALKWASKAVESQSDLVRATTSLIRELPIQGRGEAAWILHTGILAIKSGNRATGIDFPREYEILCSAVAETHFGEQGAESRKFSAKDTLFGLAEYVSAADPALLLDTAFLRAIVRITALPSTKARSAAKSLTIICRRILSIARYQAATADSSSLKDVRAMLGYGTAALPILKTASEYWPNDDEISRKLTQDSSEGSCPAGSELGYSARERLGELLIIWQRFCESGNKEGPVREVDSLIKSIAREAQVQTFGTPGEVVAYEPLQHFLNGDIGKPLTAVKVLVSGARALRDDGSVRVLVRAIVAPVS